MTNVQFGTVRGSAGKLAARTLSNRDTPYTMSFLAAFTSFAAPSTAEETPVTSVFEKVFPVVHNEEDEGEDAGEKEDEGGEDEDEDEEDEDEPEDVRIN